MLLMLKIYIFPKSFEIIVSMVFKVIINKLSYIYLTILKTFYSLIKMTHVGGKKKYHLKDNIVQRHKFIFQNRRSNKKNTTF